MILQFYALIVIHGFRALAVRSFDKGNKSDNSSLLMRKLFKKRNDLLFADKGFIKGAKAEGLVSKRLRLTAKVKKNMKNKLLEKSHKALRLKRGIIERVHDILKIVCDKDHSLPCSTANLPATLFKQ